MAELKTKKTTASVQRFILSVEDPKRRADAKIALKIMKEATGLRPAMWGETGSGPRRKAGGASAPRRGRARSQQRSMRGPSIVGFGQYHYKSDRSKQEGDWPLVGFSPRAKNLTFYIMPGFKEMQPLLEKLGPHSTSVGCLYITDLSKVHPPTLKAIIRKSVAMMKKRYKA